MIKDIYKKLVGEKTRIEIRETLLKVVSPLYYGDKYYCNCCNKSFRKFLKKGHINRLNALCPSCFSLERTRVLDLYLDKEMNFFEKAGNRVLHFAPEKILSKKLSKIERIEYIDADINPAYASHVIDITKIPYPENYFDYIICSHVLGHVPDEKLAISELFRVTKYGGIALIMTILSGNESTYQDDSIESNEDRLKNYGEQDLCRLHGNDFSNRLGSAGFLVEKVDYRLNFSTEEQKRYSLGDGKREIIFKCMK